jgi:hypothetical protein
MPFVVFTTAKQFLSRFATIGRLISMNYLLLLWMDENAMADRSPEELAAGMEKWNEYTEELRSAGKFVAGEGLKGTDVATSIKVRDGQRLVTDGPFAETAEQIGGFYLIDVDDLDEAIEWAEKVPSTYFGTTEIRPVMDYATAM